MLPIYICAEKAESLEKYSAILHNILFMEEYPAYITCITTNPQEYLDMFRFHLSNSGISRAPQIQYHHETQDVLHTTSDRAIQQAQTTMGNSSTLNSQGGFYIIDYDSPFHNLLPSAHYIRNPLQFYPSSASPELEPLPASILLSILIRQRDAHSFILLITHKQGLPESAMQHHAEVSDIIFLPKETSLGMHIHQDLMDALSRRIPYQDSTPFHFTYDYQTYHIPSSIILYIEAHERKLRMVTLLHTYLFNSTLAKCARQLDEHFIYAHRAYLINTRLVTGLDMTHGIITFVGGEQCTGSIKGMKKVRNHIENASFPCYTTH